MQESDEQSRPQLAPKLPQHQRQNVVAPMFNPYSVKRTRTPTVSHPFDGSTDGGSALETKLPGTSSKEPISLSNVGSNDVTTTSSSVDNPKHEATTDAAIIMEPEATKTRDGSQPKVPFSTSDPRWKRLPSQNVSFGSGEILTVTEILKHSHHFHNRSVRVTGVLQHRHVHTSHHYQRQQQEQQQQEEQQQERERQEEETTGGSEAPRRNDNDLVLVTLLLTDPLVTTKNKKKRPRSSILSARRISFGKSPITKSHVETSSNDSTNKSTLLKNNTPFSLPRPLLSTAAAKSFTPGPFKTPIAKGSNPHSILRSTLTPATTPRYIGLKRPLSAATINRTVSPVDTIVEDLAEQVGIWVVVNPQHAPLNDCAVGDLLMVIGEVRTMNEDTDDIMIGSDHEIRYMHNELTKRGTSQEAAKNVFHIRARIVKNVNGTNMSLQHEALLLRRQAARAVWASADGNTADANVLRPGCGPPEAHLNTSNTHEDNG